MNISQEVESSFIPKYTASALQNRNQDISEISFPILLADKNPAQDHTARKFISRDHELASSDEEELAAKYRPKIDKNLDLNKLETSSYITSKSDGILKRLDVMFENVIKKLKFYKFNHAHILFGNFLIFLIFFAVTILVSYLNGMKAYDEVTLRIKLIVEFSARNRLLMESARGIWFDHLLDEYLRVVYPAGFLNPILAVNQNQTFSKIKDFSASNSMLN